MDTPVLDTIAPGASLPIYHNFWWIPEPIILTAP